MDKRTAVRMYNMGIVEWRRRDMEAKRWDRARARIAEGRDVFLDGIRHPADCPCYDCSYGQVAEWKQAVRLGTTPKMLQLAEEDANPGRRGRLRGVGGRSPMRTGIVFSGHGLEQS